MNGFWKERRQMKRDDSSTWLITKDKTGKRIFDPEINKENMASYYENLYRSKQFKTHPYHTEVSQAIALLSQAQEMGAPENEQIPSKAEIREAIEKKKNGKATTGWGTKLSKWVERKWSNLCTQ